MRRRTILTTTAVAVLLLAGCFRLPASTDEGGGAGTVGTNPATASPVGGAYDPDAVNAARSPRPEPTPTGERGPSLEGQFTYDTMDQYVDAIVPMITAWSDATYRQMPLPRRVLFVPNGAGGAEGCLDSHGVRAAFTSESYEYCGADNTVYVGQDTLWLFYTRAGDAGPAVGLAHEFGHHIQDEVGVPEPQDAAQSITHEDQADCIAGAWTKYEDEIGNLEVPDDIQDIDALFPLIGSAEDPERDHGTTDERMAAFNQGFTGDLAACDAYYPATPLIAFPA